jgi:hypothetical protein
MPQRWTNYMISNFPPGMGYGTVSNGSHSRSILSKLDVWDDVQFLVHDRSTTWKREIIPLQRYEYRKKTLGQTEHGSMYV